MNSLSIRLALIAFTTGIGALAVPAAASATVGSEVDGNTLTVTSDTAADNIVLSAGGGSINVNGVPTTLAADDNAQIVVDAGDGADTVNASPLADANYGSLTIGGGNGDDLVTGGAGNDVLNGDGGDDRLVGFQGEDQVHGGVGNDVMAWNNGDGTDSNDGDAGNDEVEVNGSPTGGDVFKAKVDRGRVAFNRTNLAQFGIDFTAERLTVNGLGGNDTFTPDPNAPTGLAGLTSLTLNGGSGDDVLEGADGADVINGGDGSDALIGGGGDDRLVGDRGTDSLTGGDGDDTLVWNNGDGSDDETGGNGFDRVEVNGSPTAADQFAVNPAALNPGRVQFERTNLVAFTLTIFEPEPGDGGVEALTVNGGGGDDQFTASSGLGGLQVAVDGGAGDDTLTGAEEADSFFGGSGSDTLAPGGGTDVADGGEGDDQLFTRDDAPDLVHGGAGMDHAQTDSVILDPTDGVEALDATPIPAVDRVALLPRLGKIEATRRHGKLFARVPVSCPLAEAGGCRTTLTLETAKPVRVGRVHAALVLGSKTVNLGAGQSSTVSIRLAGLFGHQRRGKLPVRVQIVSQDAAGNLAADAVVVGLRIPG
jgi:Ca2+-binding RTX toxin-like protein